MRGSEKKIIHIRDTGSRIFEEAYFVLRRGIGNDSTRPSEDDMIREASRIVSENAAEYSPSTRKKFSPAMPLAFFTGSLAGSILIGIVWLLLL